MFNGAGSPVVIFVKIVPMTEFRVTPGFRTGDLGEPLNFGKLLNLNGQLGRTRQESRAREEAVAESAVAALQRAARTVQAVR